MSASTESTGTAAASVSNKALWTGRVLSALPVLNLLASSVMKLVKPPAVVESFEHLGYDPDLAFGLGIVELACTLIYVFPRTSILGAVLLTGYLGGAIATHVRIGEYVEAIVPVIFGVLVWGGLYLRDARIRVLLPWRS